MPGAAEHTADVKGSRNKCRQGGGRGLARSQRWAVWSQVWIRSCKVSALGSMEQDPGIRSAYRCCNSADRAQAPDPVLRRAPGLSWPGVLPQVVVGALQCMVGWAGPGAALRPGETVCPCPDLGAHIGSSPWGVLVLLPLDIHSRGGTPDGSVTTCWLATRQRAGLMPDKAAGLLPPGSAWLRPSPRVSLPSPSPSLRSPSLSPSLHRRG